MRWTLTVNSELAVVRRDPEYADMDHPNGEIVGEVFFLQATNDRGDRRAFGSYENLSAAEAAIPFAPQVAFWNPTMPEYGSRAWQSYGEADQMESERRHNGAESMGFDTRFMNF